MFGKKREPKKRGIRPQARAVMTVGEPKTAEKLKFRFKMWRRKHGNKN